jgi:hypothetical protein
MIAFIRFNRRKITKKENTIFNFERFFSKIFYAPRKHLTLLVLHYILM